MGYPGEGGSQNRSWEKINSRAAEVEKSVMSLGGYADFRHSGVERFIKGLRSFIRLWTPW